MLLCPFALYGRETNISLTFGSRIFSLEREGRGEVSVIFRHQVVRVGVVYIISALVLNLEFGCSLSSELYSSELFARTYIIIHTYVIPNLVADSAVTSIPHVMALGDRKSVV